MTSINTQKTQKKASSPKTAEILRVENLCKYFPIHQGFFNSHSKDVKAVNDISFKIDKAMTYSLVGESGCGKTTTGRAILHLIEPTSGKVYFKGIDLAELNAEDLRHLRQKMQIIFQDPFSSLNPRHTVYDIISEGIRVHQKLSKAQTKNKVLNIIADVGLEADYLNRYPHEFSGGQRQRIAIARALAVEPEFIVCDESVSALDVSIQAQIINLLEDLQKNKGIAYLFITHDLGVVRQISDRVGVMYLGQMMEEASTDELFDSPKHPYTKALLSAIPIINPQERRKRVILQGEIPSASNPPQGCPFHTRCPVRLPECSQKAIPEIAISSTHNVRCIHFL